ncbi:MAG: hypothetical protein K9K65_09230 [Desulfarculaceae bacterium]|nr:hypothetical protein [Desulfarculaceae bacterium]MCF8048697.1 hypothetical protein [Desulfarculaceae bacterium]MCF8064402.1 hypothetical protein [Desulfarculaceae bacterium]MCF8098011.1 hypothetical protein [Desulfarculaceae bacterium]MCF8122240.1 hypothetical protein [Desulfarculaceae bacterium]
MNLFTPNYRRLCLAALLLAGLLLSSGCGGEFWGGVGDWEPGELGALPLNNYEVLITNS